MGFMAENVIPGNYGRIFGTNASTDKDMSKIKTYLKKIDGVKDVTIVKGVFPREFIVYSTKLLSVVLIEDTVNKLGLHAVPKGWFEL
ncbi:MAG: heavy-metal-associated domain-containing protein [Maribacter sp.]|nr:heavy-metal-associated domain-containing protein [Maribacter sp.]